MVPLSNEPKIAILMQFDILIKIIQMQLVDVERKFKIIVYFRLDKYRKVLSFFCGAQVGLLQTMANKKHSAFKAV